MTDPKFWQITALSSSHDRSNFDCGEPSLDEYIKRYASQDIRRRVARVFVAMDADDQSVSGYHSLSATSLSHKHLPKAEMKKLPRYPVPASLIGRLAVDRKMQGKGLGNFLLMDAIEKTLAASESMGIYALLVDALHDRAAEFYEQYGFVRLENQPNRLFLSLSSLQRL